MNSDAAIALAIALAESRQMIDQLVAMLVASAALSHGQAAEFMERAAARCEETVASLDAASSTIEPIRAQLQRHASYMLDAARSYREATDRA